MLARGQLMKTCVHAYVQTVASVKSQIHDTSCQLINFDQAPSMQLHTWLFIDTLVPALLPLPDYIPEVWHCGMPSGACSSATGSASSAAVPGRSLKKPCLSFLTI